jgi:DNA-binding CsgD family transcriptional regulator
MSNTRRRRPLSSRRSSRAARPLIDHPQPILTAVPDSARKRTIIESFAALAQPNEWVYGRFARGEALDLIFSDERNGLARDFDLIRAEHAVRARSGTPALSVTSTLVPPKPYRHSLTVQFAYASTDCGMLLLLRDPQAGTFGVREISLLEKRALETSSLLYRALLLDGEQSVGERIQQRVPPSVYVLLSDYSIVRRPPEQPRMPRLVIPDGSRFIPLVEDAIRKKTADWHGNPDARIPASLAIPPILIASVIPLLNGEEYRIGVVIDRYSKRNALNAAAMRFNLSLRELEVIALLLRGMGTAEIAKNLLIAISTVQDYVRRILIKTHSSNRAELVSKVLGWHTEP